MFHMKIGKMNKINKEQTVNTTFLFGPGLFFLLIGCVALIAPKLLLAALAGFFLFIGISLSYFAWKLVSMKSKLEKSFDNFKNNVTIHAFQGDPFAQAQEEYEEYAYKKSDLH